MKTVSISSENAERSWYVVDMEGQTLGRAAAKIAAVLRGKNKPSWTPHADTGDFVIVINAEKFHLTGNKRDQKRYYSHSGTIGNLKEATVEHLEGKRPGDVVRKAITGMIPKNPLGRRMLRKLKIYTGPNHPHEAQNPVALDLKTL